MSINSIKLQNIRVSEYM